METMKARGSTGTRSARARRFWAIDPLSGMTPKEARKQHARRIDD
jgi:hypothetical protein